jgi:NDP-mannose synthase
MTRAMIMAGGRSERMRATLGATHKALVPIVGVPLLERNVSALLSAGFRHVVVAVAAGERELLEFAESRCRRLVEAWGGEFSCLVEDRPLGTIGAARGMCGEGSELVVVNVDNLTALDLVAMVAHHRATGSTMTIATHWQAFRVPYGEVRTGPDGVCITDLREKPVKRFRTSSGTYVLGAHACEAIPADTSMGAPTLFETLRGHGRKVTAYTHQSLWIDVNDAATVRRAERLIAEHPEEFELWRGTPDREVTCLALASPAGLWLVPEAGPERGDAAVWSLPTVSSPGSSRASSLTRAVEGATQRGVVSFDQPQPGRRQVDRYQVVWATIPEVVPLPHGAWVPMGALVDHGGHWDVLSRALEAVRIRGTMHGRDEHSSVSPAGVECDALWPVWGRA